MKKTFLFYTFVFISALPFTSTFAQSQESVPKTSPPWYEDRQGYSLSQSRVILDIGFKQLLDEIKTVYLTAGIFTNKSLLLQSFNAVPGDVRTLWKGENPERTTYKQALNIKIDNSLKKLTSSYGYYAPRESSADWAIEFSVDIPPDKFCLDSRAVEGYLDIPLDPNIYGKPDNFQKPGRHDAGYAFPIGHASNKLTPNLSLQIRHGCVSEIRLFNTYSSKEVNDGNAYN